MLTCRTGRRKDSRTNRAPRRAPFRESAEPPVAPSYVAPS